MNILPYASALLISASAAITHSCNAFINNDTVTIGDSTVTKHVKLMKIDESRVEKDKFQLFFKASEIDYSKGITHFVSSATSADLGMNNVPVLDQGQYGTCVTFSSTAALDARLGKSGFLISQECSLALDQGQGNNYWNGANYPSQIIDPIKTAGVVSVAACPSQYPDDSFVITPENYQLLADKAASALVAQVNYVYSPKANITTLKTALKAGHRVLIAFTIVATSQEAVQGFDIKVDGMPHTGGLWACKQPGSGASHCAKSQEGHEVLVIGFDDKQQLLKIRNSWSADVGDAGDYYMTYTFFNSMAVDMTQIY